MQSELSGQESHCLGNVFQGRRWEFSRCVFQYAFRGVEADRVLWELNVVGDHPLQVWVVAGADVECFSQVSRGSCATSSSSNSACVWSSVSECAPGPLLSVR